MTALTKERMKSLEVIRAIEVVLATGTTAHNNGLAALTAAGLATPGAVATNLKSVGLFRGCPAAGKTGNGTLKVEIEFLQEKFCVWRVNDTTNPVTAAHVGSDCYFLDDQTVSSNATGTSKAGRVWKVDAIKGVLFQPGAFA